MYPFDAPTWEKFCKLAWSSGTLSLSARRFFSKVGQI
jgi:hypothetical protein